MLHDFDYNKLLDICVTSFAQSSFNKLSGLDFSEISDFWRTDEALFLSPKYSESEPRSCLRFLPKQNLSTSKNSFSFVYLKKSREIFVIAIIAESTFGGGKNAPAGTLDIILGVP
jgi:hypothetical protein